MIILGLAWLGYFCVRFGTTVWSPAARGNQKNHRKKKEQAKFVFVRHGLSYISDLMRDIRRSTAGEGEGGDDDEGEVGHSLIICQEWWDHQGAGASRLELIQ